MPFPAFDFDDEVTKVDRITPAALRAEQRERLLAQELEYQPLALPLPAPDDAEYFRSLGWPA